MTKSEDGERLATLEANMANIDDKLKTIENSMLSLHAKVDTFMKVITDNYVAKDTFEEYKKNKWLERIIIILVTGIISGLIAFFLRENKV